MSEKARARTIRPTDTPEEVLIAMRRPLDSLAPDARREASQRGITLMNRNGRPGRPRLQVPENWRQRVYALASRGYASEADVCAGLGLKASTLRAKRKADPAFSDELDEVLAQAKASFVSVLVDPIVKRAMEGSRQDAVWLLERLDPATFNSQAVAARAAKEVQVNVGINVQALPAPMSEEQYRALFVAKPAKVEGATHSVSDSRPARP